MRILSYIRGAALWVACIILMFVVMDLVLITSSAIGMAVKDIIYLNVLMAVVVCIFGVLGFYRFCIKYIGLRQVLDRKECIDYSLPQDHSFHSILLRDIVSFKNDECARKTASYQSSLDELNEYITKWVHEIKIPISVCELILENADLSDSHVSRDLRVELERIKFLVNQVLYAGRAANYNEDLSVSEFNLEKTVREAVKHNAQSFIFKNIEVHIDSLDYNIINDEKWVSYILDQILNNASKYTRKNGKVEIRAQEDDKAVRLYIRDNGIGIPQQDIARVFDRGFTGENGRKYMKSTGMGLYYSKKMADKLGIGLEVSSKAGEYTEFTVVFYKVSDYLNVT